MRRIAPEAAITWEETSGFPPLEAAPGSPAVTLALAASGSNALGKVSFGTEAGLFQAAGVPAVVCGPGSIAQAHQADEFITRAELARCERFLQRLIEQLAALGA